MFPQYTPNYWTSIIIYYCLLLLEFTKNWKITKNRKEKKKKNLRGREEFGNPNLGGGGRQAHPSPQF